MTARFRTAGAFVALLALSASFAEGLWASLCAPEMRHGGIEAVAAEGTPHADCAADTAHTRSERDSGQPAEPHGSQPPKCPLGPLGVGGSCVAASLPTTASQMTPSYPEDAHLSRSPDRARDLLLAAALFHPPRA